MRRFRLAVVVVALAACGDDPARVDSAPGTSDRVADSEAPSGSGDSDSPAESLNDLKPPSISGPDSAAPLLRDAVSFVPCDEANDHVGGWLQASEVLVESATLGVCYIEHLDDGPRRYAGALITPPGYDASAGTIIDATEAGTVVTVTAGLESPHPFPSTDADATGGGHATFELDADTPGYVVRIETNRTMATFYAQDSAGGTVQIEVFDSRSPATVVAQLRQLFSAMDPTISLT